MQGAHEAKILLCHSRASAERCESAAECLACGDRCFVAVQFDNRRLPFLRERSASSNVASICNAFIVLRVFVAVRMATRVIGVVGACEQQASEVLVRGVRLFVAQHASRDAASKLTQRQRVRWKVVAAVFVQEHAGNAPTARLFLYVGATVFRRAETRASRSACSSPRRPACRTPPRSSPRPLTACHLVGLSPTQARCRQSCMRRRGQVAQRGSRAQACRQFCCAARALCSRHDVRECSSRTSCEHRRARGQYHSFRTPVCVEVDGHDVRMSCSPVMAVHIDG